MESHILLIACSDRTGLIFQITGVLFRNNLNIISNAEYVDKDANGFFMRTEFSGTVDKPALLRELKALLPDNAFIQLNPRRKKNIVLLATKESHCLGDLLLRNYSNELNANVQAVISNYNDLRSLTEKFGIKYHFVDHTGISREDHEKKVQETISLYDPEYLVLAKYMRILSSEFTAPFPDRIINIHHSFLPAFIGARPYEQAYNRGVKIIGATAHFVNENLDEGPIIAQSVIPVDHSHSATDMAQAGRDVEKIVLARALKLVLEERVFVSRNKTIIFD
jgi:formyltetrahydrofolate deformylase